MPRPRRDVLPEALMFIEIPCLLCKHRMLLNCQ